MWRPSIKKQTPLKARWREFLKGSSPGALLIDVLMASMAMTLVGTALLAGLGMTHRSGAKTEDQSLAEHIARNQMESVFNLPYQAAPATYSAIAVPPTYSVTASASTYLIGVPNIEKLTVTVSRSGKTLVTLETLRLN